MVTGYRLEGGKCVRLKDNTVFTFDNPLFQTQCYFSRAHFLRLTRCHQKTYLEELKILLCLLKSSSKTDRVTNICVLLPPQQDTFL